MAKRQSEVQGPSGHWHDKRPRAGHDQRDKQRRYSYQSGSQLTIGRNDGRSGSLDAQKIAQKAKESKTQKRKSNFKFSNEAKSQILQGNVIRGAALLSQVLSEFAEDESALGELKSLIGEEATEQALELHKDLKPSEKEIKSTLHSLPKLPEPETPIALFPSRLPDAFDTTVTAHRCTVPPLPAILDPEMAEMPFTHRSWFTNDHKRAVSGSYERLELLGDAYIEVMATRLLYPMYPDLPAGRLSAIREKMVCNETLAAFSLAYDFASRAKVPETYLEEGTSRAKIWTKLLGDFFEAYLAAVIVSDPADGFTRAETWMRALWAPRLPDVATVTDPDKNAKQELQRRLGGVGVRLAYSNERDPEPYRGGMQWFIRVALTGWGFEDQLLGRYTGRSKQVAELGAAEEALLNPLTGQIQAIKSKYDEKVRKERAEAAELVDQGSGNGDAAAATKRTEG